MKKLWMALMIAILGASLSVGNAEAKRMGGGGSMGKSSPSYSRQAPMQQSGQQAAPAQRPAQPAAPAPGPSSPWKGILGGALLGLGLGALLSHLGMGAEFASMLGSVLMIALFAIAGLFIFRMLTRKAAPAQPVPAYAGPMERSITPEIGSNLEQTGTAPAPLNWQSGHATSVPEGFDAAGFLRHAKTNFIRMQAAWDKADVNDIREFTTPEMFAELKMQLTSAAPRLTIRMLSRSMPSCWVSKPPAMNTSRAYVSQAWCVKPRMFPRRPSARSGYFPSQFPVPAAGCSPDFSRPDVCTIP